MNTKQRLADNTLEIEFLRQAIVARRIASQEYKPQRVVLTHGHVCEYCHRGWECRKDCDQPNVVADHGCDEQRRRKLAIAKMLQRKANGEDSPYLSRDWKVRPSGSWDDTKATAIQSRIEQNEREIARLRKEIANGNS